MTFQDIAYLIFLLVVGVPALLYILRREDKYQNEILTYLAAIDLNTHALCREINQLKETLLTSEKRSDKDSAAENKKE